MRLDLNPILHRPGEKIPFQVELDFSDVDFFGQTPASTALCLEGTVRNAAGALTVEALLSGQLEWVCDRCGKPFAETLSLPVNTLLAEELADEENEGEIVLIDDGRLDVEELARTAFILGMDTKHLCREDCAGLCSRCGADLNEGPCSCEKEGDPRLAALRRLLDEA